MAYPLTYQQFVNGLESGKLLGLRCLSCQTIITPPRGSCSQCGSSDLDVVELAGKGKIESFTVIRVAPEPFTAPYMICLVALWEGPRLMGNLIHMDAEKIDLSFIGKEVQIGCRVSPGDSLSGGDRVAITFALVESS